MKTHEFAKHLELLARLLRQLPNTELDSKLAPELQRAFPGFNSVDKGNARKPHPLPQGVESKLGDMSAAEVETYLLSEEGAFTAANLTELAERLGLTTSKRQGKNALVNMIARHFEATKMHSIIRGTKPEDVK